MTQEFVTLPREVVELAIEAIGDAKHKIEFDAIDALIAALDRPQNHVFDAGNMAPAGWKLVPVEPTREMIEAGKDAHYEAEKRIQEPGAWEQGGFAKRAVRAAHVFQAMLSAAPQPPAAEQAQLNQATGNVLMDAYHAMQAKKQPAREQPQKGWCAGCTPDNYPGCGPAVEQPQANQPAMTPIAQRKLEDLMASGYTISGYSVYHEQKHQHGFVTGAGLVGWWKPEGVEYPQPRGEQEPYGYVYGNSFWEAKNPRITDDVRRLGEPLYTHPQPPRQPLTDDQHERLMRGRSTLEYGRSVERAHGIK